MQQPLDTLLRKRRDRSIAIILGYCDREVFRHLPEHTRSKLRKVILDQFNEFYELLHDIAGSLDTGDVVLNEEYLGKIDEMHATLEELAGDGLPAFRARPLTRTPAEVP